VSPSTGSGSSSSRTVIAVICAIVAIVAIVAGIIYLAEPAKSLPSILGTERGDINHRDLRAATSLIIGVVFAVGAWFALKYKGKSATSASSTAKEPVSH
jgi:formate hydrogenlyase subunit 3/multisubunit Na+/H+ antiporter MnhD subunit